MGLLDGKIAKQVAKALKGAGMTKPAVLTKRTPGPRDPAALSAGVTYTTTTHPARGLVTTWRRERLNATEVQVSDRVVMLLGATLAGTVPSVGDSVTIEGKTTRIVDIERDPASATYTLLTRGSP